MKATPTMSEQIQLQRIKESGTIENIEDIMLCHKLYPLYFQLYERETLEDEFGLQDEFGDRDAQYVLTIENEEIHNGQESTYGFSIDALQVLAVISKSCKDVWLEDLINKE